MFAEYAELTTIANAGRRDLDLGNLARLSAPEYDALEPVQWPRRRKRMFADGRFYTPDGRARFVPTPWRAPAASTGDLFPLRLLTGRIRDQWHTMTRTAKAARLMDHVGEPYLEIHPEDAGRLGIEGAGIVRVSSPHGSVLLRTVVTDRVIPGTVFAPMHWTGETASQGRIDVLVAANVDPVSGQPELKAMPVAVAPAGMAWHGFLVRRSEPADLATEYWAKARAEHGWRAEVAGMEDPADWAATARALLGISGNAEVVGLHDAATGTHRIAAFAGERLVGALWVSRGPVAVARGWAAAQLAATFAEPRARLAVLAGRPGAGERDKGPIVCACLEVGRNDIAACLGAGARTIAAVGTATGAGTNCGSCRPEIGRLIAAANNVARAAAPLVDAAE
jgi:assimilatory nitrate reductase catalytic subunit